MFTIDSRESVEHNPARRRRRSKDFHPPLMRIVLLGKNVSENSRVGNFMLGRSAFESEAPDDHHSERVRGKHMTVVNSPHLLQPNLSYHQITQAVRECVNLSDPGPHVIVLIFKHDECSREDQEHVEMVLNSFSDRVYEHTLVLTTHESDSDDQTEVNDNIQQIIQKCFNRHFRLERNCPAARLIQTFEDIVKSNDGRYLICAEYEASESFTVKQQKEERVSEGVKLNLVLCGSDRTLKSSISDLMVKQSSRRSESRSDCVRREVEVCGCLISLMELPALTGLSEEEVMRQTLHCVSLCDPGVHVFLLIVPDAPLTDEDKAEMEEIQKIFSSRVNEHVITVIIQDKNLITRLSSTNSICPSLATEFLYQPFGGRSFVLENRSQIAALLDDVKRLVQENSGRCYTTFMYLQAQVELERNRYRAEIEELRRTTAGVTHSEDDDDDDDVRIVLLGKTGVGKSATGNTILRKDAFISTLKSRSVTRECQKETAEFNRRQITVIDTPGLFDTGVDNVETRKEIVKCVSMAAPGPHAFLLVLQLGRFTQEEKDAVKMIQETFGEKSRMFTMVLFTRGDDLRGTTFNDFIKTNESLQSIIRQCGNRYHVFNNNEKKDLTQVSDLLDKISCMVKVNGGSYYTSQMFKQVEKNIKEEQERIMKEKEEEIRRKQEELKAKYEAESEKMKKENEREREEMQNELRRREEEFKRREEEIKKETDENLQKELQRKLDEQQKDFEEENKRKEKALEELQQNFIKYLEEKHEREKQNLKEGIQRETREQAEREYLEKLEREVAKALQQAEDEHRKALQQAEDEHRKALQQAEDEHRKALQQAEDEHRKTCGDAVAKAVQQAEDEHRKAVQQAEDKHRKAVKEAEDNLPYRLKRARDWGSFASSVGGAVGSVAGGTAEGMSRGAAGRFVGGVAGGLAGGAVGGLAGGAAGVLVGSIEDLIHWITKKSAPNETVE